MDINIKDLNKKDCDRLSEIAREEGHNSRTEYLQRIIRGLLSSKVINLIISEDLLSSIKERIKSDPPESMAIGATVQQDLTRYYNLLNREKWTFQPFTYNEAVFLANTFNGTMTNFTVDPRSSIIMSVNDQFEFCLNMVTEDTRVDAFGFTEEQKQEFLAKVKGLTRLQSAFVIDALDQFWNSPTYRRDTKETSHDLIRVGLTTEESFKEFFSDEEKLES